MEIGISTGCLYPELTENSIRILTELGFKRLEVFFNTFSEMEIDYLDRLKRLLDSHGARVVSVHPFISSFESFMLFSAYERRFRDGARFYEKFYRAAARVGADKVVLHGLNTSYSSTITNDEYFRRFSVMQHNARSYGVELLQENVNIFRSSDPSFISDMRKSIPGEASFVLDLKQTLRAGIDPVEMIKAMGTRLRHVHISDRTAQGQCMLPFFGSYDLEGFIESLAANGYNGDIIIEVYRTSFGSVEDMVRSAQLLDSAVKRISMGAGHH